MKFPKLSKEQVADVAAYHLALTRQSFEQEIVALSPKAARAQAVISSGAFGCNGAAVAQLVSVILGEEVAPPSDGMTLLPGAIVRVHGGLAAVIVQNKGGDIFGLTSLGIPTKNFALKSAQPATSDEIIAFFEHRHGLTDRPPETEINGDDDPGF